MINKILLHTVSFLLFSLGLSGQEISSLAYSGHVIIPYKYEVKGYIVGGLSGITFNSNDSSYYLVADKPPSRIFSAVISNSAIAEITFKEPLVLSPALLSKAELEGIAYSDETGNFYVSDEQKNGTRIIEIDKRAKFVRVVEPINKPFLPLSGHNSGIEGLTISDDLQHLFYAFERPTKGCLEQSLVNITKMALTESAKHEALYYKLHPVANDKISTNGISEILFISDSRLLVMERAYIPGEGNVVRLYEAFLEGQGITVKNVACDDPSVTPIKSKLLFDFGNVHDFEIDNAEGMTFNADKTVLYIITDNNFSKKQETQVIALDVIWK